jgi:hypothetical protein
MKPSKHPLSTAALLCLGATGLVHAGMDPACAPLVKASEARIAAPAWLTQTEMIGSNFTIEAIKSDGKYFVRKAGGAWKPSPIDLSEAENIALPSADPINFVDFETRIDGVPAQFQIDQRAMVGDKDVSALLDQFKLPRLPVGNREIRVADLPEATRTRLVDQGLLMPVRTDDKGRQQYDVAWVVKTSAVRQQTFAAEGKVIVEHQYRPSVGTSPDTILRWILRYNKGLNPEVERYRKEYCVSDAFLAELDKRAGNGVPNASMIGERRINYVLKTGANWAGPIRSFKLTIDPGATDRLVSFCPGQLKPTAPNALEFTATNFKPESDLKILILGRF